MRESFTKTGTIILLFLLLQFTTNAQQKRLYIANDDHTDYMWTADSAYYQNAFITMLDWWMDHNDATANDPNPNFHSKFTTDGSFWIRNYEKFKTAPEFLRLINQIKDGKITVPYTPLILTYGAMPAEAVLRSMYYAGELERNYGLDLDMAYAMENQTLPLGLASLWKGAGAKYSWYGVCGCFTKILPLTNFESRQKEIYWYKGLDTNKVLMKWYSQVVAGQSSDLGGYGEMRLPQASIDGLDAKAGSTNYPYNIAAGFGYGWDDSITVDDQLLPAAMANNNPPVRQIIESNEVDFFKDFETTYGSSLDSLTQTYGNEWDLACASIAGVSGKIKRSLEKLRVAEAMAAIVNNYDFTFAGSLDSLKREAWLSLGLFWEHSLNFELAVPFSNRFVFQNRLESVFSSYVDQLYTLAQSNLGNLITNSTPANTRFYVFNPLGWDRTDYADYVYNGSAAIRIMDVSTNLEVPFQLITKAGVQYLRVDANNIPSVGYRVFEIQPTTGTAFSDAATVNLATNTFENSFFKIIYTNQGVLTSILDKTNGNKELVAVTGGKYVNDLGSGLDNNGTAVVEFPGPVSVTITTSGATPLAHTTKITLYKNIPRIDIDNQITQNFNDSTTWSYSFNITSPEVWHEETGAVIKAKLTTNGGHYATQNARYDWSTLNHFASVNEPSGYGVSVSNEDCYFMKIGNSTPSSLDETANSRQLNILAGGRVVGFEGFPNQGDPSETIFNQRFAITTHTNYSAAAEMKKALEHQDPMVCGTVVSPANFLLPNQFSFVYTTEANALIWALKPAEGNFVDRGIITRIWNLSSTDLPGTSFHYGLPIQVGQAKRTTHVETDISTAISVGNDLFTPLGHNEMRTYRTKMEVVPLVTKPIVHLEGDKVQESNILNWNISNETDVKKYELERSVDGQQFVKVASITAKGAITSSNYNYTDKNLNIAIPYYYRLKVIDADSKFSYSNTILIKAAKESYNIMLFPNPVTDILKVSFVLNKQSRCNVSVINSTGAVVKTVAPPLFERGNNYYMLSIKELPAGEYVFCVDTGDKKYVKSFIKK